jgi:hypothetical protein
MKSMKNKIWIRNTNKIDIEIELQVKNSINYLIEDTLIVYNYFAPYDSVIDFRWDIAGKVYDEISK